MPVSRVVIEHALDAIASDEGGMRFQGLAVVLAKLRWPELIACERKWDLGLDALAPAILSPLHVGMGLSSSTTPELEKIQADAKRAKPHFTDMQILVFVTSGTRVRKQRVSFPCSGSLNPWQCCRFENHQNSRAAASPALRRDGPILSLLGRIPLSLPDPPATSSFHSQIIDNRQVVRFPLRSHCPHFPSNSAHGTLFA